jgi:hypothetical protein
MCVSSFAMSSPVGCEPFLRKQQQPSLTQQTSAALPLLQTAPEHNHVRIHDSEFILFAGSYNTAVTVCSKQLKARSRSSVMARRACSRCFCGPAASFCRHHAVQVNPSPLCCWPHPACTGPGEGS